MDHWHELGDAYIDAYEERTGKDLQENDIQDRAKNVSAVGIKITTAGGDEQKLDEEYLKKIQAECKTATLCGDGQLTYLSDEDALTAVRLGLPVGFRTSYEGYHGSDEGMHRFHIAKNEAVFLAYKQSDSYEDKAAFHFALTDNEIEFLKSLISENEIELTKEAENISTLKVISSRTGWTFIKEESGQWHCEEHPDLIVSSDEKTWSWNSRNVGGSDAVSYLQTIEKLEINQAVNELQKHLEEKLCSSRDQNHSFGR